MALSVEYDVKITLGDAVVQAGLEINKYALVAINAELAYTAIGEGTAGIGAGAANLTDKAAVRALVYRAGGAEKSRHCVVENKYALACNSAPCELRRQ